MTALTPYTFPVTGEQVRAIVDGIPNVGQIFYIIRYTNSIVKVGYTSRPRQRMRYHVTAASQMGLGVNALWISEAHAGARKNEGRLIDFCAGQSKRVTGSATGEYFSDVNTDELLAYASKLPAEADEPSPVIAKARPCAACDRVHKRPFTCMSVMHLLATRELRVIDRDGRDVTEVWAGPPVPDEPHVYDSVEASS